MCLVNTIMSLFETFSVWQCITEDKVKHKRSSVVVQSCAKVLHHPSFLSIFPGKCRFLKPVQTYILYLYVGWFCSLLRWPHSVYNVEVQALGRSIHDSVSLCVLLRVTITSESKSHGTFMCLHFCISADTMAMTERPPCFTDGCEYSLLYLCPLYKRNLNLDSSRHPICCQMQLSGLVSGLCSDFFLIS